MYTLSKNVEMYDSRVTLVYSSCAELEALVFKKYKHTISIANKGAAISLKFEPEDDRKEFIIFVNSEANTTEEMLYKTFHHEMVHTIFFILEFLEGCVNDCVRVPNTGQEPYANLYTYIAYPLYKGLLKKFKEGIS